MVESWKLRESLESAQKQELIPRRFLYWFYNSFPCKFIHLSTCMATSYFCILQPILHPLIKHLFSASDPRICPNFKSFCGPSSISSNRRLPDCSFYNTKACEPFLWIQWGAPNYHPKTATRSNTQDHQVALSSLPHCPTSSMLPATLFLLPVAA